MAARRADDSLRASMLELLKSTPAGSCGSNRPCYSDVYGVSDAYVELDSWAKTESDSSFAEGRIKFNFDVGGASRDESVGVPKEIPTAIEMLAEPFTIGLPDDLYDDAAADAASAIASLSGAAVTGSDPGGTVLAHGFSQVPFGERVTLQFAEFGRQARLGRDPHAPTARAHHMEFNASLGAKSDRLSLVPLSGERGYFVFTEPIIDVHGLTVLMRGVDRPLKLPADMFWAVPTLDTGDLLFTWSRGDGDAMPPLSAGDRIYIRDFTSDATGSFDSYINRADGHLVDATDLTTSTFRINPGFSGLTITPSAATVRVSVAKNRIRINLRLRSVLPRLTNYISP